MSKRQYRIAVVPGDGIGKEVVPEGLRLLAAVEAKQGGFHCEPTHFPWGSDYYREHGVMMPEDGNETLKPFSAILFGAVGDPALPDHLTLWGLRLKICQGFDQYANVRPTRIFPGVPSPLANRGPGDIDWVIVRENTEGEYSGAGGRVHPGLPIEVAMETSVFTRVGVARVMRFAFRLAQSRPRKHLTVVTKSNAQRHGMVLWDEIAREVAAEFPDVAVRKLLVDAATTVMVQDPRSLDTIVATNLHADILSDLAGALAGSLGIAPTANLNPEREFPSMFEPIHGSAFDIMGQGVANPIATFWTVAMMLGHLGEMPAAEAIMAAIERVCREGKALPRDIGGTARTTEVTDAVIAALS